MPLERLLELAKRAETRDTPAFTPFLTPPEQQLAQAAARKAGVLAQAYGGFPEAERCMVCFTREEVAPEAYPLRAVRIGWNARERLTHRDVLGSLMGLGLERRRLGDIAVEADCACVMAETAVAMMIVEQLTSVSRYTAWAELLDAPPVIETDEGQTVRGTVSSARLDSVLGLGYRLSRARAAELIATGAVRLRYAPCLRPDAQVRLNDVISVRGKGRLILCDIGTPTKKDRLPISLQRLGDDK